MAGFVVTLDLSEVHALADAFRFLADEGPVMAREVVLSGGHNVVAGSQLRCPVDTGALRASISLDESLGGLGWEVGPTQSYGDYVERGTSRMSPQPYLAPTYDRELPRIERGLAALPARGFRIAR